jgi:signal transduction histidine kinase
MTDLCAPETAALVTAHVTAETALSRVNAALAALRTGLAAFDPDSRLLFANPSFTQLFGLAAERPAPGTPFAGLLDLLANREAFSADDTAAFIEAQRRLDRSQPSSMRRVLPGGEVIDIVSDPLPGGGWTMAISSISPLVRAEEEARGRAGMLQSIVDAIPHGIAVYSADRHVVMFNRAYTDVMSGAPLAVGDHLLDVIRRRAAAGEYGAGDPEQIALQQMAFDVTRPQNRKRRRPNGVVVDVRTTPLSDGGYISVVTDISPLTAAEAEVSRRAEELAVMLSSIRHGVLLWGSDQRLIATNAMASELLAQPPGELVAGLSLEAVLSNMLVRGVFGDGPGASAEAEALRQADNSAPYRRQLFTSAGRVLDFRSDPTPTGGWVSTFTDVTESRTTEDELRRAKEAAEAANQAKSRFLATMSHELRTPLNAVIGFSDALVQESANPSRERIAEYAGQINDAGRQLLGLINIILDVARIESGRFDFASDTVDIARMVRSSVRQADAAAQAAEIALVTDLPDDLPAVRADERRLQQALSHLLSNAVKFTESGGTVTVGGSITADDSLLLFVRDTGIGIPEADLERVFEPFTQLDGSLARRFQGAGLGLYVSRALVAGHGGKLTLRSRPGTGTLAEIRLPAERVVPLDQRLVVGGRP